MAATVGWAAPPQYRGLDQFDALGRFGGVDYCIAGACPYQLDFANDSDVICLLLGDIHSKAKFDDDREAEVKFRGGTSAFHPRQGRVQVAATSVQRGFVAFAYSDEFQTTINDRSLKEARKGGSTNNICLEPIQHLARYARARIHADGALDPMEVQYLGGLVYVETINALLTVSSAGETGLSNAAFNRITEYIDVELASPITCEDLARVANVPLRCVFNGVKARTGKSPYQFVIDMRLARARELLDTSDMQIAEIALACGFASQQHLTATMSRKFGITPHKARRI